MGLLDGFEIILRRFGRQRRLEHEILHIGLNLASDGKGLPTIGQSGILQVARIGPASDLTYKVEDLGDEAAILDDILSGENSESGDRHSSESEELAERE